MKVGKTRNIIRRPVNRLYPTELSSIEQFSKIIPKVNTKKKKDVSKDESSDALEVSCFRRDAAVAGELRRRLNDNDVDP